MVVQGPTQKQYITAAIMLKLDMGVDQYYHYLLHPEPLLSELKPWLREGPLGNSTSLLLLC